MIVQLIVMVKNQMIVAAPLVSIYSITDSEDDMLSVGLFVLEDLD